MKNLITTLRLIQPHSNLIIFKFIELLESIQEAIESQTFEEIIEMD